MCTTVCAQIFHVRRCFTQSKTLFYISKENQEESVIKSVVMQLPPQKKINKKNYQCLSGVTVSGLLIVSQQLNIANKKKEFSKPD